MLILNLTVAMKQEEWIENVCVHVREIVHLFMHAYVCRVLKLKMACEISHDK